MSDQPKPPADAPKDAVPAPEGGKRDDLAGHLPAKQTTWSQQVFIWTMIVLVGIIFGIGPSAGLMLEGTREIGEYQVDATEVQRRQRIAALLEQILRVPFAKRSFDRDSSLVYARDIRKARYAADLGLMPTGGDLNRLVDEFMQRKVGDRTYSAIFRDNRKSQELSDQDLKLWLAEEFAIKALAAREAAVPLVPVAAGSTVQALSEEKIAVDEVVLSAKPLLPEIKPDDPELEAVYDRIKAQRFAKPRMTTVHVVAADLDALVQAQTPTDDQVKAYYEANQAEFTKPAPPVEPGKDAPKDPPAPEVRPLAEVAEDIKTTLRRQAALAQAKPMVEAFEQTVEEQGLEDKDAAAFAAAAQAAKLTVNQLEIPESDGDDVTLGRFGTLSQKFRLHAAREGTITSVLTAEGGVPLLLRVSDRPEPNAPPELKKLKDPEVTKAVMEVLAGQRAYALLLTEAENIRAAAEAAGPGGLRTVLGTDEAKKRWEATVETRDLSLLSEITPPAPADPAAQTTVREAKPVTELATPANPVVLAEGSADADIPTVKLVQVVGVKPAPAAEPAIQMQNAQRVRMAIEGILDRQNDLALDTKLKSGG